MLIVLAHNRVYRFPSTSLIIIRSLVISSSLIGPLLRERLEIDQVCLVSGVFTQVSAAGWTVFRLFQPLHHMFQVSSVTAALTPHKQAFDHVMANRTHTRTLVAPMEGYNTHNIIYTYGEFLFTIFPNDFLKYFKV